MPSSFENPDQSDHLSAAKESPRWPDPMVTFDRLVAYLGHETSNAVSPVLSILDLLRIELANARHEQYQLAAHKIDGSGKIEQTRQLLENAETTIETLIERVTEVTRWLATFYTPSETTSVAIDIHKKLDDTLRWIEPHLHDILIVKNYGVIPPIPCFPGSLGQLFLNVFRNAVTALNGKGVLTIDTGMAGDMAQIRITDTGPGIPDQLQKRLFEPGFITRRRSAGLGLAICRHIVDSHKGKIQITSRAGHGTIVTISLPTTSNQ